MGQWHWGLLAPSYVQGGSLCGSYSPSSHVISPAKEKMLTMMNDSIKSIVMTESSIKLVMVSDATHA